MQVEVWSDVVCPWCYIGKRRLEGALARFPAGDEIEVVWRSFELAPGLPAGQEVDLLDHLAAKYGVTRDEARAMNERVTALAAGEGLGLRLDLARRGSTFDAHRILHLARARGGDEMQEALAEALFDAYQTGGQPIADHSTITAVAVGAGLDAGEVRSALAGDAYADAVREDERRARALGATGVPFFVVDGRIAVAGAQPAEVLVSVLERAGALHRAG
ncbi:MAG TPA: DsbA family oxidoreductase [Acidimicrobiales bacterium]|nr:DsbA family oxidoreductase [Acidimicrobiales bacterium]